MFRRNREKPTKNNSRNLNLLVNYEKLVYKVIKLWKKVFKENITVLTLFFLLLNYRKNAVKHTS